MQEFGKIKTFNRVIDDDIENHIKWIEREYMDNNVEFIWNIKEYFNKVTEKKYKILKLKICGIVKIENNNNVMLNIYDIKKNDNIWIEYKKPILWEYWNKRGINLYIDKIIKY